MKTQFNEIGFEELKFRRYPVKHLRKNKKKPVNGIDTETFKGYAKLIADSTGEYAFIEGIDDVLEFISGKRFRVKHNFFFNIRFDFQALFKWLPKDQLINLYKESKIDFEGYKIKYIPKKLFRVTKNKHSCSFYDINNFYETSLDKAAATYLSEKKNKDNLDRDLINTSLSYWRIHREQIIQYCKHDALLTKRLGVLLQDKIYDKMGFYPQRYISKAGLSKEFFRKEGYIPSLKGIPQKCLSYAFNAYHGGRFEVTAKGYFKDLTLIDINSAYPHQIANLIDTEGGKWYKVKDVDYDSLYGFYRVIVRVPMMDFAPIPYRRKNRVTCYPCGIWSLFMTLKGINAYEKHIDIEVINGFEYRNKNPIQPFKGIINKLYKWKSEVKEDKIQYELVKKVMNAFYGSTYEKTKQKDGYYTGMMFNPVYATTITDNTQIELWIEAIKHPKDVIGFATDSIFMNGNHKYDFSKELGGWGLDAKGATNIIRSGVYRIGEKSRNRGMMKVHNIHTDKGDYKDIFDYLMIHPEDTKIKVMVDRPVNMGEAILHKNKHRIEDINVWKTFSYVLDINTDHKRNWYGRFEKGGDVFEKSVESTPLVLGGDNT